MAVMIHNALAMHVVYIQHLRYMYAVSFSIVSLEFMRFLNWVTGDKLVGEVSRLVVAEACIQALDIEFTEGEIYEINSVQVTLLKMI